jgi:hypothetical protein
MPALTGMDKTGSDHGQDEQRSGLGHPAIYAALLLLITTSR